MVEKNTEFDRWPSLYDPLFEPLRTLGHRVADWLRPASAASSNDDDYTINVELSGVSESDVGLSVHNGLLVIKGEKKTESEQKGDTWYFSERQYGAFSRSFKLPEDAEGGKARASMKDGVLDVTVPRLVLEDRNKSQKIAISKS